MNTEFSIPFATEWTLPAAVSNTNMAYATLQVLMHFGWTSTGVAISHTDLGETTYGLLKMVGMRIKQQIYLSDNYSSVQSRMARVMKPSGARVVIAAVSSGIEAKNLLKAAHSKNIAAEGYGFIIAGHGARYVKGLTEFDLEPILYTGGVFIVETGMENAGNVEDYIALITK